MNANTVLQGSSQQENFDLEDDPFRFVPQPSKNEYEADWTIDESMKSQFAMLRDLAEFQAKYAVINRSGKTYICWKNTDMHLIEFQNVPDFHIFHAHRFHMIPQTSRNGKGREPKKVTVTQSFLENPKTRRYEAIVFDPSGKCSSKYWNLWSGFKVAPRTGDITPFNELIAALCDDDAVCIDYLMNYLAHMVQKPAELPEVAIVMRGAQGIGKGTLMKTIGSFTDNYRHLSSTNTLVGDFNGHLLDAYIVFADEAVWGGDKTAEGVLKAMITEPEVMINDKYRTAIQVRNYKRLFVASNEDWAVPVAAEGDRRYFVVDCNPRYKGQTSGTGFFARYNAWLSNGGREAVFHALQSRNISRFNPRDFPTTKARVDMMIRSLPPSYKFIFELLNGSASMSDKTVLKESNATERWQRNGLYGDLLEWCYSQGIRYVPSADDFGKAMSKAFCFEQDNPHWRSNWKSRKDGYFYEMPPKRECMKRYAKNICVASPELVFFDYPSSGSVPMDETSEAEILKLFKQM